MRLHSFFTCLFAFALMLGSLSFHAYAQDTDNKAKDDVVQELDGRGLAKAQSDALKGRVKNVMQSLEMAEVTHFTLMYSNYTVYSMVKAIKEDVSQAVDACVENNPGMENQLRARFSKWDKNVGKNMKEAYGNINSMGLAQDYISQNELSLIYGLVDNVRKLDSSQFEKVPVTTKEACEFVISKMDETEDSMNSLLAATLQSYPSAMRMMQK